MGDRQPLSQRTQEFIRRKGPAMLASGVFLLGGCTSESQTKIPITSKCSPGESAISWLATIYYTAAYGQDFSIVPNMRETLAVDVHPSTKTINRVGTPQLSDGDTDPPVTVDVENGSTLVFSSNPNVVEIVKLCPLPPTPPGGTNRL